MKTKLAIGIAFLFLLFNFNPINAQTNTELYGLTSAGGTDNVGLMFKVNGDGTSFAKPFIFTIANRGIKPAYTNLIELNNKLYGLTSEGGYNNVGVLFEYDYTSSTYTRKIDFNNSTIGGKPLGNLCKASNGLLYGMTSEGGANNLGTIFEYDASSNTLTVKYHFDGTNGRSPKGGLVQASNGKLYGLTYTGGANSGGVIFSYDINTSTYAKIFDFTGTEGWQAYGNFVEASNGKLYCLSNLGGSSNFGTIVELDPTSNTVTKKYDFVGGTGSGKYPFGSFAKHPNGKLYAMTKNGGTTDQGILLEYDPASNTFTKKYDFFLNNGRWPNGSPIVSATGIVWGMTTSGGTNDEGVIYSYDPASSTYTVRHDFGLATNPRLGKNPWGAPMIASNGKLYALTYSGTGISAYGTLVECDIATFSYTHKLNLNTSTKGHSPFGTLVQEPTTGKIFGLTSAGGNADVGLVFEYDQLNATMNVVDEFEGTSNGANPSNQLTRATSGKYYGTTNKGGSANKGTIYEITLPGGAITLLKSFTAATDGSTPNAALIEHPNGKLYGVCSDGGANNVGTIYEFNPTGNTFAKLYDMSIANGSYPKSKMVLGPSNVLLGTSSQGGSNSLGVIFEYNPSLSTYVKKFEFTGPDGKYPEGGMVKASNNLYYGLTNQGGANNLGVIYEYDASTGIATKKIDFDGTTYGANPRGSLIAASDGFLYGMTYAGGTNNEGVIFRYNPANNTIVKIRNCSNNNGANPIGNLLELQKMIFTATAIAPTTYCAGDSITVPFKCIGTFATGNTFTAQLSDASGSFASPVALGTLNATSWDTVYGIIPANTVTGSGYKVRITASTPAVTGSDNGAALTINAKPVKPLVSFAPWDSLVSNATTGNQWYLNGSPISGATNWYYIPTSNGIYHVVVTNSNGCVSDSSNNYIFLTVGISNTPGSGQVLAYPNPASDAVSIISNENIDNATIRIVNLIGEEIVIHQQNITKNNPCIVNIEHLPSGVYHIVVKNETTTFKGKFIKSN